MNRSNQWSKLPFIFLLLMYSPSLGFAAPFPEQESKLSDGDRLAGLVQRELSLHLTTPALRDPHEGVFHRGSLLQITYLEDFAQRQSPADRVCSLARWFILGRLSASGGIQELFRRAPSLDYIELQVYEIETMVFPGRRGAYRQRRRPRTLARLKLSRRDSRLLRVEEVRRELRGARCLSLARSSLSELWLSDFLQTRLAQARPQAPQPPSPPRRRSGD